MLYFRPTVAHGVATSGMTAGVKVGYVTVQSQCRKSSAMASGDTKVFVKVLFGYGPRAMGTSSDLLKDTIAKAVRFVIRGVPPRGRGMVLANAWTRRYPPSDRHLTSVEPGGARLQCDLRDELSRVVFYRGWVDQGLESWIRAWLRPGDLYVDVGAHIGYLCALAAQSVGLQGTVIAFEPASDTFTKLSSAFAGPQFPHVRTIQSAVGDRTGPMAFFSATGAWRHQAYRNSLHPAEGLVATSEVQVVTLDGELGDERVRLLKIDVEGGEAAVLTGAELLLRSHGCDALVVELNPPALSRAGTSVGTLVDRLEAYGYQAHRFTVDGELVRWNPIVVEGEFTDAVFLPH